MRTIPKNITKDLLKKLYIKNGKSCRQISSIINKSIRQVSRYLQRFGIKARPFSTKGLQPRLGAILSEATKEKIRRKHLGKKLSPEHRLKVIKTLRQGIGDQNANWQGGKTPITIAKWNRLRDTKEMRIWREKVLKRDGYVCIWCEAKENLHADHIAPFALYPELRTSVDNGRTLCVRCHRKTDTYGNKSKLKKLK